MNENETTPNVAELKAKAEAAQAAADEAARQAAVAAQMARQAERDVERQAQLAKQAALEAATKARRAPVVAAIEKMLPDGARKMQGWTGEDAWGWYEEDRCIARLEYDSQNRIVVLEYGKDYSTQTYRFPVLKPKNGVSNTLESAYNWTKIWNKLSDVVTRQRIAHRSAASRANDEKQWLAGVSALLDSMGCASVENRPSWQPSTQARKYSHATPAQVTGNLDNKRVVITRTDGGKGASVAVSNNLTHSENSTFDRKMAELELVLKNVLS